MIRTTTAVVALMLAATPVLAEEPSLDTSFFDSVYFSLIGGVALPTDFVFVENTGLRTTYGTKAGYAVAGAVGVVVMDGLSVEADVFATGRVTVPPFDTFSKASVSFMGNLKYTLAVNDMFSVYAAAGAGGIWIAQNDMTGPSDYKGSGPGYQLMIGGTARVAEHIAIQAEYRFQNSFGDIAFDDDPATNDGSGIAYPTHALMAGFRFDY